jgi:hypothetical protein
MKAPIFRGGLKPSIGESLSVVSKRIVAEQIADIASQRYESNVEFDEENADWVVFPNFILPSNCKQKARSVALMTLFPKEYPEVPPRGFYMQDTTRLSNVPSSQPYAGATAVPQGWLYYDIHINWRPAAVEWRRGDNLWTYLEVIDFVLAQDDFRE